MAKRARGGSAPTPSPKKGKDSPAGSETTSSLDADTLQKVQHPACSFILKEYDETLFKTGKQVFEVLNEEYPLESDRIAFSKFIDESFPACQTVEYMSDWTVGPKKLRPWQLSWDEFGGNKGMMEHQQGKNIVALILAHGFKTDPILHAGFTPILLAEHDRKLDKVEYEFTKIQKQLIGIQAVDEEKGWTRISCLYFIFRSLHKVPEMLDTFKKKFTDQELSSFSTISGVLSKSGSAAERVDRNREISLIEQATRSRPHCFHHLHQLNKKVKLGASESDILAEWQKPRKEELKQILGMGETEYQAVINLNKNMPEDALKMYKTAAAKYGVTRGPVTHAGFACKYIGRQGAPTNIESASLAAVMRNDDGTCVLIAKRLIHDFESAPIALRKVGNPDMVQQKQLMCRSWTLSLDIFKNTVPNELYLEQEERLDRKFILGFYDEELNVAISLASASGKGIDIEQISCFRSILSKVQKRIEDVALEKRAELYRQLQDATAKDAESRLDSDLDAVKKYYVALNGAEDALQDKVLVKKREIYQEGKGRLEKRMDTHCCWRQVTSSDAVLTEYVAWKVRTSKVVTAAEAGTWTMVVCNFASPMNYESMEEKIVVIKEIIHQEDRNMCFSYMPVPHTGLTTERLLKNTRRIEDRLMHHGVDISYDVLIHYSADDKSHGNDRRRKCARAKMLVSAAFASPWSQSVIADGRLANVPMMRVRDMVVRRDADDLVANTDPSKALGPAERLEQRGRAQCLMTLEAAAQSIPDHDKLLVLDLTPSAENGWALAVLDAQNKYDAGTAKCYPLYMGCQVESDSEEVSNVAIKVLESDMVCHYMEEWWAKQPESKEAVEAEARLQQRFENDLDKRPSLALLAWNNEGGVVIPNSTETFISADSEFYKVWNDTLKRVKAELQSISRQRRPRATTQSSSNQLSFTPDFSIQGPDFRPKALKIVEFDEASQQCWWAKARKQLPDIFITNDAKIILRANESVNGRGTLRLNSCELFGFGLGDFEVREQGTEGALMCARALLAYAYDGFMYICNCKLFPAPP